MIAVVAIFRYSLGGIDIQKETLVVHREVSVLIR
jgi:hypothetical protein